MEQYKLRIIASRTMYDGSVSVQFSPSLKTLAPELTLHLNPIDMGRVGVDSGERVSVRTDEKSLPACIVKAAASITKVYVWICYASETRCSLTNEMLSSQAWVNDISVETKS